MPLLAIPDATIAICSGVAATSNWPIADSAVCGSSGFSGKWLVDLAVEVVEVGLVEAELLRLRAQRVVAEVEPDVAEGDVAGDLEGLGERDLVAAAGAAVLVDQVGGGLRQVEGRAALAPWCPGCTGRWTSAAAAVTSLKVEPGG